MDENFNLDEFMRDFENSPSSKRVEKRIKRPNRVNKKLKRVAIKPVQRSNKLRNIVNPNAKSATNNQNHIHTPDLDYLPDFEHYLNTHLTSHKDDAKRKIKNSTHTKPVFKNIGGRGGIRKLYDFSGRGIREYINENRQLNKFIDAFDRGVDEPKKVSINKTHRYVLNRRKNTTVDNMHDPHMKPLTDAEMHDIIKFTDAENINAPLDTPTKEVAKDVINSESKLQGKLLSPDPSAPVKTKEIAKEIIQYAKQHGNTPSTLKGTLLSPSTSGGGHTPIIASGGGGGGSHVSSGGTSAHTPIIASGVGGHVPSSGGGSYHAPSTSTKVKPTGYNKYLIGGGIAAGLGGAAYLYNRHRNKDKRR